MQQNSEFLTETPGSDPHISQLHANSVMESQLLDDFLLNGSPMYQDDSMAHINIDEGANSKILSRQMRVIRPICCLSKVSVTILMSTKTCPLHWRRKWKVTEP